MNKNSTTLFGFWVYLMTDLVLFASLFAVFAVLRGAAGDQGLLSLNLALIETLVLLASSFTCGLALLAAHAYKKTLTVSMLALTFVLGGLFVGLELHEFFADSVRGLGPSHDAFASAFFALVGTHGLHVAIALVWILVLGLALVLRGLTASNLRKLTLLAYFWHFLDIVWVCIVTIVYLLGML